MKEKIGYRNKYISNLACLACDQLDSQEHFLRCKIIDMKKDILESNIKYEDIFGTPFHKNSTPDVYLINRVVIDSCKIASQDQVSLSGVPPYRSKVTESCLINHNNHCS